LTVRRLAVIGTVALCVVIALYLALAAGDASHVRRANEAGRAGHLEEALREARAVRRGPARTSALLVQARALTEQGRLRAADAAWRAVARRDPNEWQVHLEWAQALVRLGGDRRAAVREYLRARALNPSLPPLRG
jgi:predicted Zn-dependent protease